MDRRDFLKTGALVAALAGSADAAVAQQTPDGAAVEPILDPARPIVDPHHHLWDKPPPAGHFMMPELLAAVGSGHNITKTVFCECGSMYRADGPPELKSLGETEFANGAAAMSASGHYGPTRLADGMIGYVDLSLGDAAKPVLERHQEAAGERLKGVRNRLDWDPNPLFGRPFDPAMKGRMVSDGFRAGVATLKSLGLSYDALGLQPQLPEIIDLTRRFPDTTFVVNHMGVPLRAGAYNQNPQENFADWRGHILELAKAPNATMKLGGIGMNTFASPWYNHVPRASSEVLAAEVKPYIETCIEAFGVDRCMFESNYPVDASIASYSTIWNVFKRVAAGYSETEKTALFSATATRVYRLT